MALPIGLVVFLGIPAVLVLLTGVFGPARKVGPVVLCYAVGLLIGLVGVLPVGMDGIRTSVTEASLALALPLLMFAVDVRGWFHVAGRAMLSMLLAVTAAVAIATLLYYLFTAKGVAATEQLSAMAVGMYTGGIANLGAIKLALGIDDARYLVFATVDTVVGAVYLLFILTFAHGVLARFLPVAAKPLASAEQAAAQPALRRALALDAAIVIAAAGACVGAAVALAPLLRFAPEPVMVIVLLTSFGIAASFIPALRRSRAAPQLGMFGIYVFSFCVAASVDLGALAQIDLSIFAFVILATFGTFALHALLCRLMRVDVDTFLITSVAAILSPAFVPMVARSLGRPSLLISGMATGIVGFAVGNYLGITLALLLAGRG